MPYFTYLAIFAATSYSVLFVAQRLKAQRDHAKRAASLGCQPAHFRPHKLPFGIDHVLRLMRADSRGQIPDEIEKIFKEQNKDTFLQVVLGTMQHATANPRNIQAILATQFRDFELGHFRRQSFIPMLGVGIFTSDGQAW
jgi:predicted secreted protein